MKMTRQEFKNLYKNKILMISVIAIIFIPILYSSIFDKSVWDPYSRSKYLPVAVVNEDKPTELMGQNIDIGNQVVSNLKKNKQLDWHFVNKKDAEKGMKDLKYYMIVTITKDFSKNAASIINQEPKKMELVYTTNDSLNYIANEMSTVGATALDAQVREQVISAYATALVEVGGKLKGALSEAAGGSSQLYTGSKELDTGINTYTAGVKQADTGSTQLTAGTSQLASSIGPLSTGVNQLDSGAKELDKALNRVNSSILPFQSNIGEIDNGLQRLSTGTQELANSLSTFENNLNPDTKKVLDQDIEKIRNEISTLYEKQTELAGFANQAYGVSNQASIVSEDISQMGGTVSKIETDIDSYVSSIISSTDIPLEQQAGIINNISSKMDEILDEQVNSAMISFNTELSSVSNNLDQLSKLALELSGSAEVVGNVSEALSISSTQLDQSIANIQLGANSLSTLINQVPRSDKAMSISYELDVLSNDLSLASRDLPEVLGGINQLASGSTQLSSGLDQLQGKIPELSSGVDKLNSGANELNDGLNELNQNSPELLSGISQLEEGAGELSGALNKGVDETSTLKISEKNIKQLSAPTELINKEYSKVSNYGEALAPYIMSLALFVGSMLFNFVYPIRKVSIKGQSSNDWWLSKVSLGFVVSSLMALVQASIMLLIGLHVDNIPLFYVTGLVTSWTYMAIIMFLAMTFDNPGRFVAMILLVLQLGGAGGTFPVQLQGKFFQVIHPYLPMSYSVYAFRDTISGGIGLPLFVKSLCILLILCAIFILLLRYSMRILQQKKLDDVSILDNNQELQGLE